MAAWPRWHVAGRPQSRYAVAAASPAPSSACNAVRRGRLEHGAALGESRSRAPDLVVLTQRQTPALAAALVRLRQPHLAVYAGEAIGVVGPLVQPGRTACLNCLDLTRAAKIPPGR